MMPPVREKIYEDADTEVLCDYMCNRTKRYKQIFKGMLKDFEDKKYTEVYATPFENDVKAQKLITMFGFKEFARNGGFVLMKRGV
jgi:hypothetical protein